MTEKRCTREAANETRIHMVAAPERVNLPYAEYAELKTDTSPVVTIAFQESCSKWRVDKQPACYQSNRQADKVLAQVSVGRVRCRPHQLSPDMHRASASIAVV